MTVVLPKRLIVQGVAFIPEANLFVTPCTIVKELGKDMQIRFSWNGNRLPASAVVVFIGFSNAVDIINGSQRDSLNLSRRLSEKL